MQYCNIGTHMPICLARHLRFNRAEVSPEVWWSHASLLSFCSSWTYRSVLVTKTHEVWLSQSRPANVQPYLSVIHPLGSARERAPWTQLHSRNILVWFFCSQGEYFCIATAQTCEFLMKCKLISAPIKHHAESCLQTSAGRLDKTYPETAIHITKFKSLSSCLETIKNTVGLLLCNYQIYTDNLH